MEPLLHSSLLLHVLGDCEEGDLRQDDELIAFRDRFPRAREHLLIIPRRHVVGTVLELTAQDVGMRESVVVSPISPFSRLNLLCQV